MATADSPVQRTAAEHLAHLLKALGPLFKLPTRASNSSQTPTLAALRAFVDLAPDALAALDDVLPAGEEPDNAARSAPYQRELTRASGWIALWAVVRIDDLIREDEASAPPGAAPSYPVSTAPLLMLLLSRMTVQFLQPSFADVSPAPAPKPSSASISTTERFTELPSSDDEAAPSNAARPAPPNAAALARLTAAVAAVLQLAVRQPFTLVTRFVRDVGIMRPVFRIAIGLGWRDDGRADEPTKALVLGLLDSYHPSQTMSLLTPLLARPSAATVPIGQLLSRALVRPDGLRGLLQSMFTTNLDADDPGADGMRRAEAWARLVTRPPAGGPAVADAYVRTVVPRLLDLLKATETPTAFARPVSLALTRLIRSHPALVLVHLHGPFIEANLDRVRQRHLAAIAAAAAAAEDENDDGPPPPSAQFDALCVIIPLVLNAPPSSTIHDRLLTPIMPFLLALHWHLAALPTADAVLRTHVRDMCATWARTAAEANVAEVLRRAVFGGRGWQREGGGPQATHAGPAPPAQVLLGAGEEEDDDDDEREWHWVGGGQDLAVAFWVPPQPDLPSAPAAAGPSSSGPDDFSHQALAMLDLQPPPDAFVAFVSAAKRPRAAGALFIGLLGTLHRPADDDATPALGPLRELVLSKIVLRMVEVLGEDLVKGEAARILEFVHLVLRSTGGGATPAPTRAASLNPNGSGGKQPKSSFGLADLRIVPEGSDGDDEDDAGADELDSDDESLDSDDEPDLPPLEDSEHVGLDDGRDASGTAEGKMGIIGTAVGLLIAVLQADEHLTPASNSLIVVIAASLEQHASSSSLPAVRHLCKEALLIFSLRSATSSMHGVASGSSSSTPEQDATAAALERYQEALKLIADPSVPVRAHGLILLRQLVLPPTQQARERPNAAPHARLPPALVPAIVDVFVQAVQDSDSYVYLNAVKGIAAMVDGHGRDVLGRLMRVYAKGVASNGWSGSAAAAAAAAKGKGRQGGAGEMDVKDLDMRLRVGEALCGVVERCDGALGQYGDVLIPPLLLVFRAASLPTSLRASALSILSLIADTSPLTFATHLNNLVLASVDLLQVETVARPRLVAPVVPESVSPATDDETAAAGDDDDAAGDDAPQDRSATVADAKHPMLRRTALKFLGSAIVADSHLDQAEVDAAAWARVGTVVGYVRATDVDPHVRSLAGEVGIMLKERLLPAVG